MWTPVLYGISYDGREFGTCHFQAKCKLVLLVSISVLLNAWAFYIDASAIFFFIELDITTLRRILYLFSLVSEVCTESLKGAGVPSSIWWNLVVHVYRIPSVDWKWNRCIWEHLFGIKQVLTYFEKRGLLFLLSVQCYYWKNKITILLGITFGCIYWHWVLKLGFHIMDFLQNWLLNTIYRFICIEHFKFRIG